MVIQDSPVLRSPQVVYENATCDTQGMLECLIDKAYMYIIPLNTMGEVSFRLNR